MVDEKKSEGKIIKLDLKDAVALSDKTEKTLSNEKLLEYANKGIRALESYKDFEVQLIRIWKDCGFTDIVALQEFLVQKVNDKIKELEALKVRLQNAK